MDPPGLRRPSSFRFAFQDLIRFLDEEYASRKRMMAALHIVPLE
jgi:hypothetical protein